MPTRNFVPRESSEGSLGTLRKKWDSLYVNNLSSQAITNSMVINTTSINAQTHNLKFNSTTDINDEDTFYFPQEEKWTKVRIISELDGMGGSHDGDGEGAINNSLKALANRTDYLYTHKADMFEGKINADVSGNAETATKLKTAVSFILQDNDGSHTGSAVTFDGTKSLSLKLPATITGSLDGNASTSSECLGNAATATRLTTSNGSHTTPVYFQDGKPIACTSIALNVTGNASSATKLNTNGGNASVPVYFKDGKPVACTSISLKVANADYATTAAKCTGNSETASKLTTSAGSPTTPVYFQDGKPIACTKVSIAATSASYADVAAKCSGTAESANKLNTSAGSPTTPVYFKDGKPVACTITTTSNTSSGNTSVSVSMSTADKLSCGSVGNSSTPVYFSNGVPIPCSNISTGSTNSSSGGGVPTGTVIFFAGSTPPNGFLKCDGASYSRSSYSALYSVIGTTYGGSSNTFCVPNLLNRFAQGIGSSYSVGNVIDYDVHKYKNSVRLTSVILLPCIKY